MNEFPVNSATTNGQTSCLNCDLLIEKCKCVWAAIRDLQNSQKVTKNHLQALDVRCMYRDDDGDELLVGHLAEDVRELDERTDGIIDRVVTLEKFAHNQLTENRAADDSIKAVRILYDAVCKQVDGIESKGIHWIEFYNKQNSDHTGQLYQLSNQVKETLELIKDLERIVLEPIAQKVVDGTQKTFLDTYAKPSKASNAPMNPYLSFKEGFNLMFNTLVQLKDSGHLMTMEGRSILVNVINTISQYTDQGKHL